ncbi:MAG: hypothetical protein KF752_14870 [Pirellulaceae bacterium]|nr:hypothetical protein [Pirellulaceae bacterium]
MSRMVSKKSRFLAVLAIVAVWGLGWNAAQVTARETIPLGAKSESTKAAELQNESDQVPGTPDPNSKSVKIRKPRAAKQATDIDALPEAPVGRLPRYFAGLVDPEQRDRIRELQADFRQRIEELTQQLDRLKQEELAACEEVLTDAQRKLLQRKRAEAHAQFANKRELRDSSPTE